MIPMRKICFSWAWVADDASKYELSHGPSSERIDLLQNTYTLSFSYKKTFFPDNKKIFAIVSSALFFFVFLDNVGYPKRRNFGPKYLGQNLQKLWNFGRNSKFKFRLEQIRSTQNFKSFPSFFIFNYPLNTYNFFSLVTSVSLLFAIRCYKNVRERSKQKRRVEIGLNIKPYFNGSTYKIIDNSK